MNYSKQFYSSIIIFFGCLLPGCRVRVEEHNRDYLKRFPRIEFGCDYSGREANVDLKVHVFSKKDSKQYFGSTMFGNDLLIKEGYLPIHINISNNSNAHYTFQPSYINLIVQPSNRVANHLHVDTQWYMTWYGIPTFLFFWELVPLVIIPMGISMKRSNAKITQNLQHNALQTWKSLSIAPYETIDKFIFVRTYDFKQNFELKLFNDDDRKLITFNVDLICGAEFTTK